MMRRLWFRLLAALVGVAVVGGVLRTSSVRSSATTRCARVCASARSGAGAARICGDHNGLRRGAERRPAVGSRCRHRRRRHRGLRAVTSTGAAGRGDAGRYAADGGRRLLHPGPVAGPAEISGLGLDINHLAGTLEATEERRTRLLSELAHELRTPLTAIDGYVEGLQDGVFEPDQRVLASIAEETARLRRLAGDLTTVARAEEGAFDYTWSEVDLNAVAVGVVERLRPQFDASTVSVDVSVAKDPAVVRRRGSPRPGGDQPRWERARSLEARRSCPGLGARIGWPHRVARPGRWRRDRSCRPRPDFRALLPRGRNLVGGERFGSDDRARNREGAWRRGHGCVAGPQMGATFGVTIPKPR